MTLPVLYRDHLRWTRAVRWHSAQIVLISALGELRDSNKRTARAFNRLGIVLARPDPEAL